jgi:PleD family two-component response regulator
VSIVPQPEPGVSVETEKIKVLLVDDDQGDFEMIRVMLANAENQEYKLD